MEVKYQDKLAHLSEEEVQDLMLLYYEGEKNELLIKEYNIDIKSSFLNKTFPLEIHDEFLCPYCDVPLVSYRKSKSSYTKQDKFCEQCNHQRDSYCSCESCKNERVEIKKEKEQKELAETSVKREKIIEIYENGVNDPIDITKLKLREKLFISSLLRSYLSEDLRTIKPASKSKLRLAPTTSYMKNIIASLVNEKIILFSPDTDLESIIFTDNDITGYYPTEATYKLNVPEKYYEDSVNNLLYIKKLDNIDIDEVAEIWSEIAEHECLEFLYAKLEEYNLPADRIGDKTISAINNALNDYSTSQLFNFIWGAVKNAAAYCQKEGITNRHAVNTIAGNISRRHEKATVEGWETKTFGRDYNYPQTILSEVFFNNILEIGDKGFTSTRNTPQSSERDEPK